MERWKPVTGWEKLYEVSDRGGVRSLPRRGGRNRLYGGITLKPRIGSQGYPVVCLSDRDRDTRARVHRLVLEAHVGPPGANEEARHLDADKTNCSLTNLAWGTHAENMRDEVRLDRPWRSRQAESARLQCGEKASNRSLSADAVHRIRSETRMSQRDLARMFGVSQSTIWRVLHAKTWRCLLQA